MNFAQYEALCTEAIALLGTESKALTPTGIRDVGQAVQDTRLILNVVRMPSDTDTDTVSGSDD